MARDIFSEADFQRFGGKKTPRTSLRIRPVFFVLLLIVIFAGALLFIPQKIIGYAVADYIQDEIIKEESGHIRITSMTYNATSKLHDVDFVIVIPSAMPSGKPINASYLRSISLTRTYRVIPETYARR